MKSLLFSLILILSTNLKASENLFQGINHEGKSIRVDFDQDRKSYVLQFDSKNPVYFPTNDSNKLIDLFIAVRNSTIDEKKQLDDLKKLGQHIMQRISKEIPFPSNEELIKLALKTKAEAETIIAQTPQKEDCPEAQKKIEAELKKKEGTCACLLPLPSKKTSKDSALSYALIVGKISPEKENPSYRGSSISYNGLNDQPFHGAANVLGYDIGEDLSGHTYGSEIDYKAEFDWGDWGVHYGTNLFVTPYSYVGWDQQPRLLYKNHPEKDDRYYFFQNADEMTNFEINLHYFPKGKPSKYSSQKHGKPYYGLTLGIEEHRDQKGSFLGGINHRDLWHKAAGAYGLEYIDHMKDRRDFTAEGTIGREDYFPIGSVAFCTKMEAGIQLATSKRVSLDSKIEAEFNTGKLGGARPDSPLFAAKIWANIWQPFNSPETEHQVYDYFTPSMRGPIKDSKMQSYGVGLETGGKKVRFSVEAIYENNSWSDSDLTYAFKVKYKY